MRRVFFASVQIGLAALLVGGCASTSHQGASHDVARNADAAADLAMAPTCPAPSVDLVVGTTVAAGARLPAALHGPFSSVGVSFGQQSAGMKVTSARLDVVDRDKQPPGVAGVASAGPSAAAQAQDQLAAGSEAGVVARSQLTTFSPGPFVVSLAAVNQALHLTGTPSVYVPPTPTYYATPGAALPPTSAVPAGGYEVYLVMQYQEGSCRPGATASGGDAHSVVDLATLLP